MADVFGTNTANSIGVGTGATSGDDALFGWAQSNGPGDFGPNSDGDTLHGDLGADVINGGGGQDRLFGDGGSDTLYGGDGNDTLTGGGGSDVLSGGKGNDVIVSDSGLGDLIVGGAGDDTITGDGALNEEVSFRIAGLGVFTAWGDILSYHNSTFAYTASSAMNDFMTGPISGLIGSAFDDVVQDRAVWVYGLDGNDLITTIGTDCHFYGGAGNDTLRGHSENTLRGGLGDDDLAGIDWWLGNTAVYDATDLGATVNLTLVSRQDTGAEGHDLLDRIWHLEGGRGNDHFTGNSMKNRLSGKGGDDYLSGGVGDDELYGGNGADTLDGGEGTDYAIYEATSRINLTDPSRNGGAARGDVLINIETILVWAGTVVFRGDYATNVVETTDGADRLLGLGGDDRLSSGGGKDFLSGGDGADSLNGGGGADTMVGGRGNDVYVLSGPGDVIVEKAGGGIDTVQIGRATASVADYGPEIEGLRFESFDIVDLVHFTGTDGANILEILYFSGGNAVFSGLAGRDTLTGAGGADLLDGGEGADVLRGGGEGADSLIGGAGNDRFVFGRNVYFTIESTVEAAGRDTILDFRPGHDKIDVHGLGQNPVAGQPGFEFIGSAAFDGNADDPQERGQVRVEVLDLDGTADDRTFVFGTYMGLTTPIFAITLIGLHDLTATDFIL